MLYLVYGKVFSYGTITSINVCMYIYIYIYIYGCICVGLCVLWLAGRIISGRIISGIFEAALECFEGSLWHEDNTKSHARENLRDRKRRTKNVSQPGVRLQSSQLEMKLWKRESEGQAHDTEQWIRWPDESAFLVAASDFRWVIAIAMNILRMIKSANFTFLRLQF